MWVARGRRAAADDYDDMFTVPHQMQDNPWYLTEAEQMVRRNTQTGGIGGKDGQFYLTTSVGKTRSRQGQSLVDLYR